MQSSLYFISSYFLLFYKWYKLIIKDEANRRKYASSLTPSRWRIRNLTIMIIDYSTNFKQYEDKILCFQGIWSWDCPCCGSKHAFHRHGTYMRNLLIIENSIITEETIEILRLLCTSCGHTHAILPWDVIPFQIYSASAILQIFFMFYIEGKTVLKISSIINISYQLLYSFLNHFVSFLKQLELLLRFLKLWSSPTNPTPSEVIKLIMETSHPPTFFVGYLCVNLSPLLLARKSSSAYPLVFGFSSVF